MDKNQLNFQYRALSLESETFDIKELTASIKRQLVTYVTGIKSFIHETMTPELKSAHFSYAPNKSVVKLLKVVNYMSIERITVYVPSGMTCDMLSFIDVVSRAMLVTDRLIDDCLKPALVFFSQMLSAPELMSSITGKNASGDIVFHTKEIERLKSDFSNCFDGTVADVQRDFGVVYKRNGDYIEAQTAIERLCNAQAKNSAGEIMHHLNDLTEVIDRLMARMSSHPEQYAVTGITSGQMSDVTRKLAEEVEFYAAVAYHVQTLSHAISETDIKLVKVVQ